ncbi:MAG TPA: efflux RND transporter periplasmic adaptor subunit, partial [candidate division Zixibacteria bacterium]|nr:efflux RND transporter periplasmic adaptor subunit [candidate division Zixibacteria bacterium]
MTKKKKIFLFGGIGLLVVVLLVLNLTGDSTKRTTVAAEEVENRNIVELVSASGRVEPKTKVNITSEVNGKIIRLAVKEGDEVRQGQLLIVLDTVQLRSDVDQALYNVNEVNARLSGAAAALENAKEEFDRQQSLFDRTLTSETAYKNAKFAHLDAKSQFEAWEAQAKQAEFRYEKSIDYFRKARIVAPMTGVVTFLDCEEGEVAAAQTAFTQGKTLMTISDLSVFEVQVEVDETEINKVTLGQKSEIEVDAFPDTTFPGEVIEIGNTASVARAGTQEQATNFYVKVVFKDSDVKVKPGMSATVEITSNERAQSLSVPYSAIVVRAFDMDSLAAARAGKTPESSSIVNEAVASESGDSINDKKKSGSDEIERKELKGVFVIQNGTAKFVEVATG